MVAINISARQFLQADFVALVAATLERTGADPGGVCLEITESILMDDVDVTVDAAAPEGPWREARRRRLRHGLLVAVVPAPIPRRHLEGRPVLRERAGPRPGGLGHRAGGGAHCAGSRSEEHTSELQSLMRISYAVFCLKNKNENNSR